MTKENFLEVLHAIEDFDKFIDDSYELGIDLINSSMVQNVSTINKILLTEIYGKDGYEWIEWYLYEKPMLLKDDKTPIARYTNGDVIDFSSDEKLWEFLEEEGYGKGTKCTDAV
jgi:hypothetical protein